MRVYRGRSSVGSAPALQADQAKRCARRCFPRSPGSGIEMSSTPGTERIPWTGGASGLMAIDDWGGLSGYIARMRRMTGVHRLPYLIGGPAPGMSGHHVVPFALSCSAPFCA